MWQTEPATHGSFKDLWTKEYAVKKKNTMGEVRVCAYTFFVSSENVLNDVKVTKWFQTSAFNLTCFPVSNLIAQQIQSLHETTINSYLKHKRGSKDPSGWIDQDRVALLICRK